MENNRHQGISVVLPVYNGLPYLRESVASVLAQDFDNYELIVSDDGSADGSREYLQSLQGSHPSLTIVFQEKNLGLFPNLNFLLGRCRFELIHLWSQDDIMKPECLREVVAFHNRYEDISMSYHGVDYIDANGDRVHEEKIDGTPALVSPGTYAKICIRWGCIAGNIANVTLVKSYLEKYGCFDASLKVSGDFELFTRLSAEHHIGFQREHLIYLRQHKGQLSRSASSVIPFVTEDIPINKALLERQEEGERPPAEVYWRWKVQVYYVNHAMFLFRERHFKKGFQLLRVLHAEFGLPALLFRWSIMRFLRLVRLDNWFYTTWENRLYARLGKTS